MSKERRNYSEQFKNDTVDHYHTSGKSMREISLELGVSPTSIYNWVKKARSDEGLKDKKSSASYSDMKKEIFSLKKQLSNKEKEIKDKDNELLHKDDEIKILKGAIGILYN